MRSHAKPWFALTHEERELSAQRHVLHLRWLQRMPRRWTDTRNNGVAYTFNELRQLVCDGTHCGCYDRPIDVRIPGLIHGIVKSPLGR